jgi:tetratricopeptide (TPR) repeat protein
LIPSNDALTSSYIVHTFRLLSFGSLYEKLGRYSESQSYYLEAFEIYQSQNENISSTTDMGVALTSIGWIRYLSSDFEGALRVYENAVTYLRLTLGSNHRNVASVLIQTGMAHVQQGNLKQALRVYNEALRSQREVLGDDHEDVALSLCHISSTLEGLGDLENALQCVSHSLLIYTNLFGSQHLQVALTLVHLAGIYQQMDENNLSIACYMDASNVYKANGAETNDARVLLIESALQELNQTIRLP